MLRKAVIWTIRAIWAVRCVKWAFDNILAEFHCHLLPFVKFPAPLVNVANTCFNV